MAMPSKKKYAFPRPANAVDSNQPKHRKPRKLMPKPTGVSHVEWRVDVQRREAVTTDRRRRLDAKKIRDAASCTGMMNPPGCNP
ncbi:hypothetical protein D1007_52524 [Hordeum vulgare]|nr:hypothetical protein D1007_52524 [Hordeum vulgare]